MLLAAVAFDLECLMQAVTASGISAVKTMDLELQMTKQDLLQECRKDDAQRDDKKVERLQAAIVAVQGSAGEATSTA